MLRDLPSYLITTTKQKVKKLESQFQLAILKIPVLDQQIVCHFALLQEVFKVYLVQRFQSRKKSHHQ